MFSMTSCRLLVVLGGLCLAPLGALSQNAGGAMSNQPNTPSCEPNCIGSSNSNAPNLPASGNWQISQDCMPDYKDWQGMRGRGAFALSQDGVSCGYSFDYRSSSAARDRAMRECSERGDNCKIIAEK